MIRLVAALVLLAGAASVARADDPVRMEEKSDGERPARRIWVGLGVGSGAGYANGDGVEAFHEYVSKYQPGFAPASLAHATPELGYFLREDLALSLQGRVQYRPHGDQYTADGAWAVLGRLLYFSDGERARFYSALALGGGDGFRLSVDAKTLDDRIVQDTVRGGPFVAGAGGGFSYALGERLTWIIETNLLVGVPIVSMVLDVNTGLRASF